MRHSSHITFRAVLISFLGLAAGCGGKPPTEPSPNPLLVTCPASVIVEATSPEGALAMFDPATASGGKASYSTECLPGSGETFPIGDTTVTCTTTDADEQQAACSFVVRVRVSQTLTRTRFVAFGDSITEGQVSSAPSMLIVEPLEAYPLKLEQLLRNQFPAQSIVVLNRGVGGEELDEGVKRLPTVLDGDRPEVLLLLEGINNIRNIPTATAAGYLRTMIVSAKDRGIDVIIAKVMPISAAREAGRRGTMDAIRRLNAQIVLLAAEYELGSPVDLFGLFEAEPSLLGMDGLHPTAEGYTRIAALFRDAVVARYETKAGTISSRNRMAR